MVQDLLSMYKIPSLITIKNPKDIAQSLNQYFVNAAENIDKEIPRTRKCPLDYMGVRNISSFFCFPN